ncbi:MAG: ATP-binding protein [Pseudonocardiaceae bacterium]
MSRYLPGHGHGLRASGLRPHVDRFVCCGSVVEVVDPVGILLAADREKIQILHDARFPEPVTGVSISVATDTYENRPVYSMEASIMLRRATVRPAISAFVNVHPAVVGAHLLRKRAGRDPRVTALMLAGAVAYWGYHQVRAIMAREVSAQEDSPQMTVQPPDSGIVADAETGLTAWVNNGTTDAGGSAVVVHAVFYKDDGDTAGPSYVQAFARILLDVVIGLVRASMQPDDTPLAGRTYVLSRYPDGRWCSVEGGDRVILDHVGGLPDVVEQLREIAVSFRHPDRMAMFGARPPQGIILHGPPGTGKTMLAHALANEIGADFTEKKTPDIVNKFIGDSAKNIKHIFDEAKAYTRPTVLLFDEFDTIIGYSPDPDRGAADQELNSVAGVFKQEMNTLAAANPQVIVVATTNHLNRVDESLVRSGRFDVKIEVPLPDEAGRREIFTKMIRREIARHERSPFALFATDVDPPGLAARSGEMSGADIAEVLRRVQHSKGVQYASTGTAAPITQEDIVRTILRMRNDG